MADEFWITHKQASLPAAARVRAWRRRGGVGRVVVGVVGVVGVVDGVDGVGGLSTLFRRSGVVFD